MLKNTVRASSPLTQFRAKSKLDDIKAPQQILVKPFDANEMEQNTMRQTTSHAMSRTFTERTQRNKWNNNENIKHDKIQMNSNIADSENLKNSLFISQVPEQRLDELRIFIQEIVQHDEHDLLFGKEADDDKPIVTLENIDAINQQNNENVCATDRIILNQQNQSITIAELDGQLNEFLDADDLIKQKKNLSELEMFNVAFDECIQVLNKHPQVQSIINTIQKIKNYYVNKIVRKSSHDEARDRAINNIDAQCVQLKAENEILNTDNQQLLLDNSKFQNQQEHMQKQLESYLMENQRLEILYNRECSKNVSLDKQATSNRAVFDKSIQDMQDMRNRFKRINIQNLQLQKTNVELTEKLITEYAKYQQIQDDYLVAKQRYAQIHELNNTLKQDTLQYQKLFQELKSNVDANYFTPESINNTENIGIMRNCVKTLHNITSGHMQEILLEAGANINDIVDLRCLLASLKNEAILENMVLRVRQDEIERLNQQTKSTEITQDLLEKQDEFKQQNYNYLKYGGKKEGQQTLSSQNQFNSTVNNKMTDIVEQQSAQIKRMQNELLQLKTNQFKLKSENDTFKKNAKAQASQNNQSNDSIPSQEQLANQQDQQQFKFNQLEKDIVSTVSFEVSRDQKHNKMQSDQDKNQLNTDNIIKQLQEQHKAKPKPSKFKKPKSGIDFDEDYNPDIDEQQRKLEVYQNLQKCQVNYVCLNSALTALVNLAKINEKDFKKAEQEQFVQLASLVTQLLPDKNKDAVHNILMYAINNHINKKQNKQLFQEMVHKVVQTVESAKDGKDITNQVFEEVKKFVQQCDDNLLEKKLSKIKLPEFNNQSNSQKSVQQKIQRQESTASILRNMKKIEQNLKSGLFKGNQVQQSQNQQQQIISTNKEVQIHSQTRNNIDEANNEQIMETLKNILGKADYDDYHNMTIKLNNFAKNQQSSIQYKQNQLVEKIKQLNDINKILEQVKNGEIDSSSINMKLLQEQKEQLKKDIKEQVIKNDWRKEENKQQLKNISQGEKHSNNKSSTQLEIYDDVRLKYDDLQMENNQLQQKIEQMRIQQNINQVTFEKERVRLQLNMLQMQNQTNYNGDQELNELEQQIQQKTQIITEKFTQTTGVQGEDKETMCEKQMNQFFNEEIIGKEIEEMKAKLTKENIENFSVDDILVKKDNEPSDEVVLQNEDDVAAASRNTQQFFQNILQKKNREQPNVLPNPNLSKTSQQLKESLLNLKNSQKVQKQLQDNNTTQVRHQYSKFKFQLDGNKNPLMMNQNQPDVFASQRAAMNGIIPSHYKMQQGMHAMHPVKCLNPGAAYIVGKLNGLSDEQIIDQHIESQYTNIEIPCLQLKNQESATKILQSQFKVHPAFGQFDRHIPDLSEIPDPERFFIAHPIDKIYLKYCKIDNYYAPCVLSTLKFSNKLIQNTDKSFDIEISRAALSQKQQQLNSIDSMLPKLGGNVKYVRFDSLSVVLNRNVTGLTIFKQSLSIVTFNSKEYIELPTDHVIIKSETWVLRFIREILAARLAAESSYLVLQEIQPSSFVTQSDQLQKDIFKVIQCQIARKESESLAAFSLAHIRTKYGSQTLANSLLFNLYANLAYHQYFSDEIYLFTRMFFDDLETDIYLSYLELRKVTGFTKNVLQQELIPAELLPNVVSSLLRNWSLKRQFSFLQTIYAVLYSQADKVLPETITLPQLSVMILHAYASYRRAIFQQTMMIYTFLTKEMRSGEKLKVGSFRQLMELVLPQLNKRSVDEYYYGFSKPAGDNNDETNLSKRIMSKSDFTDFFMSLQLGRYGQVDSKCIDKIADIELKKLIIQSSHVYENMRPVITALIAIVQRRAETQGGEYLKYNQQLRCYLDVIQCDILAYNFEAAMKNMKIIFGIVVDAMIQLKPDMSVVAVGGAMAALKYFLNQGQK